MRHIGWFSCGAASAVACRISNPDVWAYCETGSEHPDNARFMKDIENRFNVQIEALTGAYKSTWHVWEKQRYLAGIKGAPCTRELKVKPRLAFQQPGDVHIFGYTADRTDRTRFEHLRENYPDLDAKAPLIEAGLTKSDCLGMLEHIGIDPPLTYEMGLPNANCIPCVKATSPAYWSLIRLHFPNEFQRMTELSRKLKVRLARYKGNRVYIDEIPLEHPITSPVVPACDILCQLHHGQMTNLDIFDQSSIA